jgi:glycerophosphoryl diester phosphodiesterase
MLVIAHRGASGHLPENTLPAYELAVEMRADMIEVDLHRTRDGEIVICHDAELEGLPGEVGGATAAEVRSIDLGDGARVPTLDELLDGFGSRIPLNLEIKWGGEGDYPGLEEHVLRALDDRGLGADIVFSSFRPSILQRLRSQAPTARLALLFSPRSGLSTEAAIEIAAGLGAEALNPYKGQVDEGLVSLAHEAGLAVYSYTVDDEASMRRFLELEVDGIFTNLPDRLRKILEEPV